MPTDTESRIREWTPDPEFIKELENMKKIAIIHQPKRVTLFDLLTATKSKFNAYSRSAIFKEIAAANKGDFSTEYPHYGFLLNIRTTPALQWHNETEIAISSLKKITRFDVPWHVANAIFSYLRTADLKNLNKAIKDANSTDTQV